MKATGIIRRVDDLGRVVIPKEIRRLSGISYEDPLEFFVDSEEGCVCMKKYNPMGEIGVALDQLAANTEYIEAIGSQREAEALIRKLRKIFEENS